MAGGLSSELNPCTGAVYPVEPIVVSYQRLGGYIYVCLNILGSITYVTLYLTEDYIEAL